jgi:formylglycine-generating enzyme required for sulfatase activity
MGRIVPPRPNVFLSSTSIDLKPYRDAAQAAAQGAGFFVIAMEFFAPSGRYSLETCLAQVDQADVLVVIVANRYGSTPPGRTQSFTHLECLRARERRIEVIPFLIDDEHPWPPRFVDKTPEIDRFKEWLRGTFTCGTFTGEDNLALQVNHALFDWRRRNPRFGQPEVDTAKYLELLWKDCRYIDIEGLVVSDGRKKQFEIDRIYIPLTTSAPVAGTKERREHELMPREVPLQTVLQQPRVMIVGDPGAGKSTFLRRVAFSLAHPDPNAGAAFTGLDDHPFPILIRAVELSDSPDLPEFLASRYQEPCGLDAAFFRRRMTDGPCLVMIDGMDEAPNETARNRIARLIEKAAGDFSTSHFVVTTRPPHDGWADFTPVRIGDLGPDAIQTFFQEWADALYPDLPDRARPFRERLQQAINTRPEIRRLATNPVMLTALAVLQANNRTLPEQRVELYESILKWLAEARRERRGVSPERRLELQRKVAIAMQGYETASRIVPMRVQVERTWAAGKIEKEFRRGREQAIAFLKTEEEDSGVIVSRGDEVRFWHRTFQEYLAAREIASWNEDQQKALLTHHVIFSPEWREVMMLLAGVLRLQGRDKADFLFSTILGTLPANPSLAAQARVAALLGAMMRDLWKMDFEPTDAKYRETLLAVNRIFDPGESAKIDIRTRIEAAEALGQVGDLRLEEPRWVTIPAGTFWMGAQKKDPKGRNYDPGAYDDEAPVHEVYLDAFQIGRYAVTVHEFAKFIEEGGYQNEEHWAAGGYGQFGEPDEWDQQKEFPNRPVVGVNWFEAAAWCSWAGVRLPTEAEWERAARGKRGGKYPWGDEPPIDPSRANYGSKIGRPVPVGLYPLGCTSEGLYDMIGNVWEWCQDWLGGYEKGAQRNPRGGAEREVRVLRGGAWSGLPGFCRVSLRNRYQPVNRNYSHRVSCRAGSDSLILKSFFLDIKAGETQ